MNLNTIRGKNKKILIIIFDILLFNISYWLSYNIRDEIFIIPNSNQLIHLSIGNFIFVALYLYFEINNFVTRYFDFIYIKQFIKFLLIFFALYFFISITYQLNTVSRSSPIIITLVYFSLVIVSRFVILTTLNHNQNKIKDKSIVIGDGDKVYNFQNFSIKNKLEVIAFFSKNKNMLGRKISNINIYSLSKIENFLSNNKIERAIIASDQFTTSKLRKLTKILNHFNIRAFHYNEQNEDIAIDQINKSNDKFSFREIEFFFKKNSREFHNSTILITGAGGSIGSELSKQLLQFKPKKIILFELSEINLFNINRELEQLRTNNTKIISILGNVNNLNYLDAIFGKYKPDLVYHAAAVKHVVIAENNPLQCIKTNVIGTKNVMFLSNKYLIKKFILISTDKAVNPINVMGSSKRVAEIILKYYQSKKTNTIFTAVRFGNVANSSGSVFPIWRNQIKKYKKITITDPKATRYLMSIKEAVSLVLDASILGSKGKIFVLDMGKPFKIIDLAKIFLKNYGLKLKDSKNQTGQISYEIIGLRPGEKKHEELFYGKNYTKTLNSYIYDSNEKSLQKNNDIKIFLDKLDKILIDNNDKDYKKLIKNLIKNKI
jgi:FlaA1/EpsC-like NDP-sugar epimerase